MVEAGASALLRSSDLLLPSQIAALHQHPAHPPAPSHRWTSVRGLQGSPPPPTQTPRPDEARDSSMRDTANCKVIFLSLLNEP